MAVIREPKIYADSYQLSVMVFDRTRNFPKHFRPTLARRLEEATLDLMLAIRLATLHREARAGALARASQKLDEMRMLLQLSHDMHLLNAPGYAEIEPLKPHLSENKWEGFRKQPLKDQASPPHRKYRRDAA